MEIKLTEAQEATIKILVEAGHKEQELIVQFINIGICFYSSDSIKRKIIMDILEPK